MHIYFALCLILLTGFLWSCGGTVPADISTAPESTEPSGLPAVSFPSEDQSSALANRVDILYFHPKKRCATCISVELRTKAVLDSYFKDGTISYFP